MTLTNPGKTTAIAACLLIAAALLFAPRVMAKQMGMSGAFTAVPLTENQDQGWVQTFIGCPKNAWGEKAIERINRALVKVRPTAGYYHFQTKWFPPAMEPSLQRAYQKLVLDVTETSRGK